MSNKPIIRFLVSLSQILHFFLLSETIKNPGHTDKTQLLEFSSGVLIFH